MSTVQSIPVPQVLREAGRRRTFAVISHPDTGKSTLTEALALHARAITSAGAVHAKGDRRGVTSDWMELERERGISVTSAALQFGYRGHVMNLVDTPGHADFSEDTYRVLAAVDCAIMLVDAAKGLEEQTRKLFAVCRHRGVPVITFINKWDRRGQDALTLLEDIETHLGITPVPVVWPVGTAGNLRGLVEAGNTEQSARSSPAWCSRSRRTWTRPIATGSPSSESAPASSSAACTSPGPPAAARSQPSTRTPSSEPSAPWSTPRTPAMWSA
ncbi:Peptide chain release factor 3 [Kitasatospora purpeofusca]